MSKSKNKKPVIHNLKTWTGYYERVANGTKTFEFRTDDRDYQVGDHLVLREWCPDKKKFSGRTCERVVTYILRDFTGLMPSWCVMAIQEVPDAKN